MVKSSVYAFFLSLFPSTPSCTNFFYNIISFGVKLIVSVICALRNICTLYWVKKKNVNNEKDAKIHTSIDELMKTDPFEDEGLSSLAQHFAQSLDK